MYNRYACRCDEFRRAEPIYLEPVLPEPGCGPPQQPCAPQARGKEINSSKGKGNGLLSFLNFNNFSNLGNFSNLSNSLSFLPKDLDLGDILLFAVLFLLFLEKGDEECLIILAVLLFMN